MYLFCYVKWSLKVSDLNENWNGLTVFCKILKYQIWSDQFVHQFCDVYGEMERKLRDFGVQVLYYVMHMTSFVNINAITVLFSVHLDPKLISLRKDLILTQLQYPSIMNLVCWGFVTFVLLLQLICLCSKMCLFLVLHCVFWRNEETNWNSVQLYEFSLTFFLWALSE